jgi:hypothetical protein
LGLLKEEVSEGDFEGAIEGASEEGLAVRATGKKEIQESLARRMQRSYRPAEGVAEGLVVGEER